MKVGKNVHLFHSSKVEAQKKIAIGDVLPVYRMSAAIPSVFPASPFSNAYLR
jgi:hypothetical protein